MFMCKNCHEGKGKEDHTFESHTFGMLGVSLGQCELCGDTANCVDCKGHAHPLSPHR